MRARANVAGPIEADSDPGARSHTRGHVETTPTIRFRGAAFVPLHSGALFWPATGTLLVADLHLEKLSSFARSGQLLPPYDTGLTLARLESDLRATGARRVVALGDSFHRDEGTVTLLPHDRARLAGVMAGIEWIWLSGNHDPSPHALGGICRAMHTEADMIFAHVPARGTAGLVAGHLHPAARVMINGRSVRRPCFVHDEHLMILPAYGSAAGSLNILGRAFAGLLKLQSLQVTMLGRERVYPVNPARLVGG